MGYQITRLEVTLDGWHITNSAVEPGLEPDEMIGRLQEIIKMLERHTDALEISWRARSSQNERST